MVSVDGRTVRPTPAGLLRALGSEGLQPLIKRLNRTHPVLMLDAYEDLTELTRYVLDEFLPRLDSSVRVVIAGRSPLRQVWQRDAAWQRIVRPLPLEALPTDQARTYLGQRGLGDRPRRGGIRGPITRG